MSSALLLTHLAYAYVPLCGLVRKLAFNGRQLLLTAMICVFFRCLPLTLLLGSLVERFQLCAGHFRWRSVLNSPCFSIVYVTARFSYF